MGTAVGETDVRRIAAEASCDPRTVKRYLAGEPVRPLIRERIQKAAKSLRVRGV